MRALGAAEYDGSQQQLSRTAIARLRPGVTLEQARAEMDVVAAQLRQRYPKENEDIGALRSSRSRDELPRQSRLLLTRSCGAAVCVLLIACANLANLLLARALGAASRAGGPRGDRRGTRAAGPPVDDREPRCSPSPAARSASLVGAAASRC